MSSTIAVSLDISGFVSNTVALVAGGFSPPPIGDIQTFACMGNKRKNITDLCFFYLAETCIGENSSRKLGFFLFIENDFNSSENISIVFSNHEVDLARFSLDRQLSVQEISSFFGNSWELVRFRFLKCFLLFFMENPSETRPILINMVGTWLNDLPSLTQGWSQICHGAVDTALFCERTGHILIDGWMITWPNRDATLTPLALLSGPGLELRYKLGRRPDLGPEAAFASPAFMGIGASAGRVKTLDPTLVVEIATDEQSDYRAMPFTLVTPEQIAWRLWQRLTDQTLTSDGTAFILDRLCSIASGSPKVIECRTLLTSVILLDPEPESSLFLAVRDALMRQDFKSDTRFMTLGTMERYPIGFLDWPSASRHSAVVHHQTWYDWVDAGSDLEGFTLIVPSGTILSPGFEALVDAALGTIRSRPGTLAVIFQPERSVGGQGRHFELKSRLNNGTFRAKIALDTCPPLLISIAALQDGLLTQWPSPSSPGALITVLAVLSRQDAVMHVETGLVVQFAKDKVLPGFNAQQSSFLGDLTSILATRIALS